MGSWVLTTLAGLSVAWGADVDLEILENGTVQMTAAASDLSDLSELSVSVYDGHRNCKFTLSEPTEFEGREYYCESSLDDQCPDLAVIGSFGMTFRHKMVPTGEVMDGFYISTGRGERRVKNGEMLTLELVRDDELSRHSVGKISICSSRRTPIRMETSETGLSQRDSGFEMVSFDGLSSRLETLRAKAVGSVSVPLRR